MPKTPIEKPYAEKIMDILVEECGASRRAHVGFHYLIEDPPTEYRFQGKLGFGGKIYFCTHNLHPWRVACYPEDETPEARVMIDQANERLQVLWKKWMANRFLAI